MASVEDSPPFRRQPIYFHVPDLEKKKQEMGEDRWRFITALLYQQFWLQTSFELHRIFFGELIWEMYNQPWKAKEAGYSDAEIRLSVSIMQSLTSMSGTILGREIEQIHNGDKLKHVDPSEKYCTWDEIAAYTEVCRKEGCVVGMNHGAYDPPHNGHARQAQIIWPHTDTIIVGFDPNWYLRDRKGVGHPRFPLAGRMWNIASLPTVDRVFVLPVNKGTDGEFFEIYRTLNVKVMGTSTGNPLLEHFHRHMEGLGGFLVAADLNRWTSTELMRHLARPELTKHTYVGTNSLQRLIAGYDIQAFRAGYLKDYPDKTWKRHQILS